MNRAFVDERHNAPVKRCAVCEAVVKPIRKYCSPQCSAAAARGRPKSQEMRQRLSIAIRGKQKPAVAGDRNPNYGNRHQSKPEARARFLEAVARRGQGWSEANRQKHRELMLGPANKGSTD